MVVGEGARGFGRVVRGGVGGRGGEGEGVGGGWVWDIKRID